MSEFISNTLRFTLEVEEKTMSENALSSLSYRESHRRFNSRNFSLVIRVG